MDKTVTVYVEGSREAVQLRPTDHLATGGEGCVYLKNGRIFKVYLRPEQAMAAGLDRKVALLRSMVHPCIAAPEALLCDRQGRPVGLTLPFVPGDPLCRAFTNTWRDARGFSIPETIELVDAMREVVDFAHAHQALMVDANELNWLIEGTRPKAIDVDSWQVPGFPATAIMPSIRDHASPGFNKGTDWFAWAVVTFQLFVGIHPYKGTHPTLGPASLEERMRARASVFDAGVRLPPTVRDLGAVPSRLRDWYASTFQSTNRTRPPRAADSAIAPQTAPRLKQVQSSTATLSVERVASLEGPVALATNGFLLVRRGPELMVWDAQRRIPVSQASPTLLSEVNRGRAALVRLPGAVALLTLDPDRHLATARDLDTGQEVTFVTSAHRLWQSRQRAFFCVAGSPRGLQEIEVRSSWGGRNGLSIVAQSQWPVNVLSTAFHHNVFVQDVFGSWVVGVTTERGLVQGMAPALRGHRVIDGFAADEHNVWLTTTRMNDGETLRLRLSFEHDRYVLVEESLTHDLTIDAAQTLAGVSLWRRSDELLVAKGRQRKTVSCTGVSSTLRLFGAGTSIFAFDGSEVVHLSLAP